MTPWVPRYPSLEHHAVVKVVKADGRVNDYPATAAADLQRCAAGTPEAIVDGMTNLADAFALIGRYFRSCKYAGWVPQPAYHAHRVAGLRLAGLERFQHLAHLTALDCGSAS